MNISMNRTQHGDYFENLIVNIVQIPKRVRERGAHLESTQSNFIKTFKSKQDETRFLALER